MPNPENSSSNGTNIVRLERHKLSKNDQTQVAFTTKVREIVVGWKTGLIKDSDATRQIEDLLHIDEHTDACGNPDFLYVETAILGIPDEKSRNRFISQLPTDIMEILNRCDAPFCAPSRIAAYITRDADILSKARKKQDLVIIDDNLGEIKRWVNPKKAAYSNISVNETSSVFDHFEDLLVIIETRYDDGDFFTKVVKCLTNNPDQKISYHVLELLFQYRGYASIKAMLRYAKIEKYINPDDLDEIKYIYRSDDQEDEMIGNVDEFDE